ncbi:MAG: electron transport complex subunit RsxB [Pseudomonadota bacterium]
MELISQYPLISSLLALASLGLVFGAILGFAAVRFKAEGNPIVDQINDLLPQTQCGQCGYPGCRPYAEAIAGGDLINKCPPGGEAGIQALADLLDQEVLPLDEEHGEEKVKAIAFIREDECIGCTKCIQACPVDAILGAAKQMHTVISSECTGCDLCLDPCPVDCIDMIPEEETLQSWHWPLPDPVDSSASIIATDVRNAQHRAA